MREWPSEIDREWIPEQEVTESGLLAHINRSVLWPLGMALAVYKDDDGYKEGMRILRNKPFDPIAGEESAQEIEATERRFAEWLRAHVA